MPAGYTLVPELSEKPVREFQKEPAMALQDGKEVSFLFLPEGEDPDSYIRTHGQAAFLQLL